MITPQTEIAPVSPILRWAGSKRKIIPDLLSCVPRDYIRYVEPFAGSACLFFALRPKRAILGDLNQELVAAYDALKSHPVLLHRLVSEMPRTKRFYYALRSKGHTGNSLSDAARFVYLNRHCFNGVYRTNRRGEFNVPRGSRVGAMPDCRQFRRCANVLRSARLIAADFESVLGLVEAGDFVYLDPPYAKIGARQRGEYGSCSFRPCDLQRLSAALEDMNKKGATFVLSYADCEDVLAIRNRWYNRVLLVRRHVAGFNRHRSSVQELLVSNRPI